MIPPTIFENGAEYANSGEGGAPGAAVGAEKGDDPSDATGRVAEQRTAPAAIDDAELAETP